MNFTHCVSNCPFARAHVAVMILFDRISTTCCNLIHTLQKVSACFCFKVKYYIQAWILNVAVSETTLQKVLGCFCFKAGHDMNALQKGFWTCIFQTAVLENQTF